MISDLQIEYSLLSRGIESEILPTCEQLGIGVTAYGVLSRGLLSGHWSRNRETGPAVAQVAIAWVLSGGKRVVPLVGARTRERLTESLGALEVELSADDVVAIESALPAGAAAGERYDDQQMAILDSERS